MINLLFILLISTILLLIFAQFNLWWIKIELFFLSYKLENHPKIIKIIEDKLNSICKEDGITVFYKSAEDMNSKEPDKNNWACGQYVYSTDIQYIEMANKLLSDINEFEKRYNDSSAFERKELTKDMLFLPRIILSNENIQKYGILSHYATFIHELGHHFAVKKLGSEHNEDDANNEGWNLILTNFPKYIQSIFYYEFLFRINKKNTSSFFIKFQLYLAYFKYSFIEKYRKNKSQL